MNWIIYGFLAVIIIVVCDISRKHLSNQNCDTLCITFFPLIIGGILSFLYICFNKNELKYDYLLKGNNWFYMVILTLGVIFTQYCINCALFLAPNPGYAKAIVASNILITTIISSFIFKNIELNITKIIGICLILFGIIILIYKK
tara:strand:- start:145 stop:579 length:435 start_codon:yes stop_codon:yes gene_type:complete